MTHYLQVLQNLEGHKKLHKQIPVLENKLSSLLHGVRIVHNRQGPLVVVHQYSKHLTQLLTTLEVYLEHNDDIDRLPDLSNLQLLLEW